MRTFRGFAGFLVVVLALAGCGALGGESPPAQGGQQSTKIKVAVLPTMDVVPLQLAIDNGYFQQEGLEVETVTAASGADCVTKMVSGEVQIAFSSWTPFFVAKSKGQDIRLVADATAAAPGYAVVVVLPNSPIAGINDLAGKRIAITARNTISHLLVQAQLKAAGVDYNTVQFVELPFPQMSAQLTGGQIDAAFFVEPFVRQAAKAINARTVFDALGGEMSDLPLTGYGATSTFVNGNRETIQKFQRVLKKATDEVRADRKKVDPVLQKVGKVDAAIASEAALTEFVSALEADKIQRVVDLMVEFKALETGFAVSEMIERPPS